MDSRLLAEVTTTTLESVASQSSGAHRVLWALGSLEQHGPHLPMSTDAVIAEAVTNEVRRRLNADQPEVATWWQLPTLGLGASGEHEGFPGTVSIGTDSLVQLILEVGRSASRWSERLILLTGHGGNAEALTRAVGVLRSEGREACWMECRPSDQELADTRPADAHAGFTETSLMLNLRPDLVTPPYPLGNTDSLQSLLPSLQAHGMKAVSPNGVLGDAREASAEVGARYFHSMVADAIGRIARHDVGENGRLRTVSGPQ